ncbi:uncharacterized protein LOC128406912 [Podarcis raffonei]|uniref:uncharacterized protein LOC128406912 n=1 Tax=Podarcis raffonei TaxID=65483 RepID=UPI002329940D|nr:uncharacterized protein LOC128406912 [Podarcis raffonei]
MASIINMFRRLRDMIFGERTEPKKSRAAVRPDASVTVRPVVSRAQQEKDESFLSCVLATCSEARMREKDTLRYSKNLAVKSIAEIMGRIPCFTHPELVLAMALEALYQLSLMKPKLPLKLHSLIVHAAFAAVVEVKSEPDRHELDERYTLMLGGLLWEAPSAKLLNLLMNELRGYARSPVAAERQLAASGIGSLMSYAKALRRLKNVLIPLELAHFCPKEDDIMLSVDFNYAEKTEV